MIVLNRKTGEVLEQETLTEPQRQTAWEQVLRAYLEAHPEALAQAIAEVRHAAG